ncbi:MAG: hypothetical protein KGH75_05365 [Rhodospirillales bacterium]|nr:hypothetical protein [Rhodospirillales bacterium]
MSHFAKFASAAVLAASLAPFAAQARSGDFGTSQPQQHLVRISNAPAYQGRAALNTQVPADFKTAPNAAEYANAGDNNGYNS